MRQDQDLCGYAGLKDSPDILRQDLLWESELTKPGQGLLLGEWTDYSGSTR